MAIETILLAVGPGDRDRIERLVEETIDVAGPTGARVVLAHVFTREEFETAIDNLNAAIDDLGFDTNATEVAASDAMADDVASRHATIREMSARFEEAGVKHDIRGGVGDHGETIVALAEDVDADRVIVGGRRRSPAGKAVFGSVAQEVMLSAPCPVTFVRADTK